MELYISFLLSTLLALVAIYKKSFTTFGVILAWICAMIITYCGNIYTFLILSVTFFITIFASKLTSKQKEQLLSSINEKHGKRDAMQVFCNVGVGAISLLCYHVTKMEIFVFAYTCVMASSLADSVASEIGILSKGKNFDLRTLKPIEKGLSGGVSILGLTASFLGSLIISICYYFYMSSLNQFILVTLLGFIGAFVDSILGAFLQVKYQCPICKQYTEKKYHCDATTVYQRGIRFLNNDLVNLCNNIITFILAIMVYYFFF